MSRLDPEQTTLRLPRVKPTEQPEATTIRLPTVGGRGAHLGEIAKRTLIKVPEVTLFFWVVKLLTTALGESTSDYLVHRFDPVKAVMLGAVTFALALGLQLAVRRYIAGVYWLAVIMVAVFGTMAADVVHIVLGVPYLVSSVSFALALAVIFFVWYRTERTLDIHSIYTWRRELFYWATIITTFALGTALGDLTAITFKLGYLSSLILFGVVFAIPAVGYFVFGLNEIGAFWFAYILTRPIGASFADWMGKPPSSGGLGVGPAKISGILAVAIIGFVGYLTVTRKDIPKEPQRG